MKNQLFFSSFLLLVLIFSFIFSSSIPFTSAQPFRCTTPRATCTSLIDYVSPNATTLSSIRTLFSIRNLRTILGANNLSLSTPSNFSIPARLPLRIPFPCICTSSSVGISNRRPIYTVVPGDTLYHIAAEIFSRLVTFEQIQSANNITDANLIEVGQRLWIPLPCSCDDVDGQSVVHYGHVVAQGSSLQGIAQQYNTTEDTLLRLNNLTRAQDLLADSVLDVPLRACSSAISNNSTDYPLLVANGTYVFTAGNCVLCRCDAAMNWTLRCEPAQINSSCSPIRCEGADNLFLGNTTSSGCNRSTCAYAGYSNSTIMTTIATESTCPAPGNGSSTIALRKWSWSFLLMAIHMVLLCVSFF